MSTQRPKGQVFERSGGAVISQRASGRRRHYVLQYVERVYKRKGRPPDERVAGWASRIKGPDFQHLGSLRAKCRHLAWTEYEESGGDLDALTERGLAKLTEQRRVALTRLYKKRR